MNAPAKLVSDTAATVASMLEGMDARSRLSALMEVTEAARRLRIEVGAMRGAAMWDLVDEVGATAAGRELGISRARVYQLTERE